MSHNSSSLRRTIDSAKDLQSVVRTMKALAASSIGQYESSVRALADYYRTVELGLGACFREQLSEQWTPKVSGKAAPAAIGAVVFGSDQGLVGQFNETVADFALERLEGLSGKARIWAVGERVQLRLVEAGVEITRVFAVPNSVQTIGPLVGQLLIESEDGADARSSAELHLFYNRPTSPATHEPVSQRLLPLDEGWRQELVDRPWPTERPPEVLGGAQASLSALLREHLFISLYRACAESLASENASRLLAMQRADKNIEGLLEELNARFHRLRQSGIDEELFDVISGVEALSSDLS